MENVNEDTSFNLYNIINKYYENKLLIFYIVSVFVIIVTLYNYSKPITYNANITIGEGANMDFIMDEQLSRYFKTKNINSKLFLDNFFAKIKKFSTYEKLSLEINAESDSGKFNSLDKLNKYDAAKYIYDRVGYKKIKEDLTGTAYQISYTDSNVNVDEVASVLGKLVLSILNEDISDLKKNVTKEIDYYEYKIKKIRKNHEIKMNKLKGNLNLEIDKLIIELNYAKLIRLRNLKEQIQVAKKLGIAESQIEVIDEKLIDDQLLNKPLYFFGYKVLEEELKHLQLNTINIDTIGNFGGQELLAELETIKYQQGDNFIAELTGTVSRKDDLLLLEKSLDNFSLLGVLEYELEEIKVIKLNNITFIKLILSAIILSLLLSTLLILYRDEHKIRNSKQ